MRTGIPEIDELTQRSALELPMIAEDQPWIGPIVQIEWTGQLANPMFNAYYCAFIGIGDFGLYRLGHIKRGLIPKAIHQYNDAPARLQ